MVDTDELETFLNPKVAKIGDIVEVLGEGTILKNQQTQFGVKDILNVPVVLNGNKNLTWSPPRKAREQMNKLCNSKNTKDWIGKKFQVTIIQDRGRDVLIPGNLLN
jgi:hypothetical protein